MSIFRSLSRDLLEQELINFVATKKNVITGDKKKLIVGEIWGSVTPESAYPLGGFWGGWPQSVLSNKGRPLDLLGLLIDVRAGQSYI